MIFMQIGNLLHYVKHNTKLYLGLEGQWIVYAPISLPLLKESEVRMSKLSRW